MSDPRRHEQVVVTRDVLTGWREWWHIAWVVGGVTAGVIFASTGEFGKAALWLLFAYRSAAKLGWDP